MQLWHLMQLIWSCQTKLGCTDNLKQSHTSVSHSSESAVPTRTKVACSVLFSVFSQQTLQPNLLPLAKKISPPYRIHNGLVFMPATRCYCVLISSNTECNVRQHKKCFVQHLIGIYISSAEANLKLAAKRFAQKQQFYKSLHATLLWLDT